MQQLTEKQTDLQQLLETSKDETMSEKVEKARFKTKLASSDDSLRNAELQALLPPAGCGPLVRFCNGVMHARGGGWFVVALAPSAD